MAVHAGLQTLKKGGRAADAALATALAQVVEFGGCYVSYAGILSMIYYEADTRTVHYLNAGFNTTGRCGRPEEPLNRDVVIGVVHGQAY